MIGLIRNIVKEKLLILQGYTKEQAKEEISKDKNDPAPNGPSGP